MKIQKKCCYLHQIAELGAGVRCLAGRDAGDVKDGISVRSALAGAASVPSVAAYSAALPIARPHGPKFSPRN